MWCVCGVYGVCVCFVCVVWCVWRVCSVYGVCVCVCVASYINPLNAKFNPICHLLALLGAHHIFHVSGLRVKGRSCSDAVGT